MAIERSSTVTTILAPSALLDRPGAVVADGADAGVAWHYGDPVAEQRAIERGEAVVDQSHMGVVTVTGPDRLTWLDSLGSQKVDDLAPGVGVEYMILSPQGRVEHVASLVDDGETTWVITESAPALAAYMDRMRFMLRVEVADVSSDWAVLGEAVSAPATAGEPVTWVDSWPTVSAGGTSYRSEADGAHPGAGRAWRLVLVPRASIADAVQQRLDAGWTLAGTWASEAARVEALRPRAALEVDATAIPHELDWLRTAVHLNKGCYRGQETVAKVHNVGRPPRRLTLLHLDGSEHELPAPGAAITIGTGEDAKQVGHVTTAARHHELGPIALALIKRNTDPEATLAVATEGGVIAAGQEAAVNSAGESVDRPPKPGPTAKGLLMGDACKAPGGDMSA